MSLTSGFPANTSITLPTDPKLIGPGVWFIIHRTAKRATSEENKKAFLDLMSDLSERFPCPKCRTHIQKYLVENPIKTYWNLKNGKGEEIGMFTWAWNFHNAVNSRLDGKPYVDFDTAWNLYTDSGISVCTKGCGEESETSNNSHNSHNSNNNYHSQTNVIPDSIFSPQTVDEHKLQPSLLRALGPSLFS